jgi:hypothetical protein
MAHHAGQHPYIVRSGDGAFWRRVGVFERQNLTFVHLQRVDLNGDGGALKQTGRDVRSLSGDAGSAGTSARATDNFRQGVEQNLLHRLRKKDQATRNGRSQQKYLQADIW